MSKGFDDIFDEVQRAKAEHASDTVAGRSAEELDDLLGDDAYQAYNTDRNRNLGSVLDTIQDQGPAGSSDGAGQRSLRDPLGESTGFVGQGPATLEDDVVMLHGVSPISPASEPDLEPALFQDQPVKSRMPTYPMILIASAVAAIAALLGVTLFQLQSQADALATRLESVEQTRNHTQDVTGRLAALNARLADLAARVDQLAGSVDALANRPSESGAATEAKIEQMREAQQAELAAVQEQLQSLRQVPPRTAAKKPAMATKVPAASARGEWVVNLATLSSPQSAAKMLEQLRQQGIAAEQQVATVKDKQLYRLRIAGFPDRPNAEKQARELKKKAEFADAWVSQAAPERSP